ncbi:MAG: hypothetical protein D8M55_11590 [Chloroflexi bacterium]|nr:hypothetical protein [Chloroflexota bacterium]
MIGEVMLSFFGLRGGWDRRSYSISRALIRRRAFIAEHHTIYLVYIGSAIRIAKPAVLIPQVAPT